MNLRRTMDRGAYIAFKVASIPQVRMDSAVFSRRNRIATLPVIAPGGPVVSLTSYGDRVANVYLTIESIARGTVLPSRLILWLNEEEAVKNPPIELRRLQARGLEILLAENYGPHTKYFPFVNSESSVYVPLATADDDTLYPSWWLARLVEANIERPDLVNCYRARIVAMNGGRISPYANWNLCRQAREESIRLFALGVSGVIYPPAFLTELKKSGDMFLGICPKADDIWLHLHAVRSGIKIRQIGSTPHLFATLPNTQRGGLYHANKNGNRNDDYIRNAYTTADIEVLSSWKAPASRKALGNSE